MVDYSKLDFDDMRKNGYDPGDNWDVMRYESYKFNMVASELIDKEFDRIIRSLENKSKVSNSRSR